MLKILSFLHPNAFYKVCSIVLLGMSLNDVQKSERLQIIRFEKFAKAQLVNMVSVMKP